MAVPCVFFFYGRESKLLLMAKNTPSVSARGGFKLPVACDSIVDLFVGTTLL